MLSSASLVSIGVLVVPLILGVGVIGWVGLLPYVVITPLVYILWTARAKDSPPSLFFIYFVFIAFWLSICYALNSSDVSVTDLQDLFKPLLFFIAFSTGYSFFNEPRSESAIQLSFWLILLFSMLLAVDEYIGTGIAGLYIRDKSVLALRSVAFFKVTYFAASVYLLLFSMFFARWNAQHRFSDALGLILSALLLISTQSRAGLVTLAILLFFFIALNIRLHPSRLIGLVLGLGFSFFLIFSYFDLGYLTHGLSTYGSILFQLLIGEILPTETGGSLNIRLMQIGDSFGSVYGLVFGSGGGRLDGRELESFIALTVFRGGVIFLLLYFLFWLYVFVRAIYLMKNAGSNSPVRAVGQYGIGLVLTVLLVGLTSILSDQLHLYSIFYFMAGYVVSTADKYRSQTSYAFRVRTIRGRQSKRRRGGACQV